MIYGRFGDTIAAIRPATADDVRRLDPPLDYEAMVNVQMKSWVVCTHEDGVERISHLAYLRADDGLKEIMDAMDESGWQCVYCGAPVAKDERCASAACEKKHNAARRRMGLR